MYLVALKNIMVRAKKKGISEDKKARLLEELEVFEKEINGKCMLHKLLESNKLI